MTLAAALAAEPGFRSGGMPFLTRWEPDDHGGAPGNLGIVQHPQTGFVYVGNNAGLLEFDGASWRLITLANSANVPVVVIDAHGTVWLGTSNAVAVLRPDAHGDLQPVDVTGRLPPAERDFGRLYVGAAAPDGVYFASPTHLVFLGHDGTSHRWPSGPERFNGLSWFAGALYASRGPAGLARLEGGTLVPVAAPPTSPNPAMEESLRLFAARADSEGTGATLLTDVGPMHWAGPGSPMVPLSAAAVAPFAQRRAFAAAFLRDGRFAYSLPRQGLLLIDAGGTAVNLLTPAHGLPWSDIDHLATDDQGGLWLAQVNGLARLQIESRYATHGKFDSTRAFLRRGNRLYLAHNTGVVWRDDANGELHRIEGLPTGPNALFDVADRIFCSGQYLREITDDDRAVVALPVQVNALTALPLAPGAFVAASVDGLRLLHFDGATWRDDGLLTNVRGSIREVSTDGEGCVWATGYVGAGSWRVNLGREPGLAAEAEYFDPSRGLPFLPGRGQVRFLDLGGVAVTIRGDRMLRHDRASGRFVPEDRIDGLPAFDRAGITPGADGELWMFINSPSPRIVHIVRTAENRWRAEAMPAGPLRDLAVNRFFFDRSTGLLWFGGGGPPIAVDPAWQATRPNAPFRALIRRVTSLSDDVLLGGASALALTAEGTALRLDPEQNSLHLAFTGTSFAGDYRGKPRTAYRTRLEGVEKTWTGWSATPWREFTDLPYRHFVFHVQARDIEGRESTVGSLAFSIAPPWWLARPALAGYAALTLLAIAGIFRLRTRALRRRNDHLEAVVAARTAELERLRRLEMDEKISARLAEEKARLEVLRYQLNPHFLFNTLNSIYALVWSHSRPAGELVRRLAEFCRMTLTRGGPETATLAEEFTMLRAYLDLEKIRWEENLLIEFSLAPGIEGVRLPPFLLLPLVENAVKYGSHTSPDLLRIRVAARPEAGNSLVIEIANSGTWVEPGSMPAVVSTGIGLENLRQRLARHYPGAHEFTVEAKDGWVVMRLQISTKSNS